MLAKLSVSEDDLAPEDPEVIVLPEAEQPLSSMRVQTLPSGEQTPVPTRGEFEDVVRKVALPAGRKRPGETDQPRERSD